MLERQFRRYLRDRAATSAVSPARPLLQLLETRLDNVVFRLGFANSRSAARQIVSHGHVQVNGRKVNISSFNVKAGDDVTVKDKPKSRQLALRNLELTQITPVPDWLTVDTEHFSGKVARIPSREEIAADRQRAVDRRVVLALGRSRSETTVRRRHGFPRRSVSAATLRHSPARGF